MRNFKAPPLSEGAENEIQRAKVWLLKSDLPLTVEVGCGAGYHPLAFVRANPRTRILAFERTTTKYEKANHRLRTHLAKSSEYERCLIIHGDATHLWSDLFLPKSLDGLFFLYPNPYPKKQHANRRLAGMPFFATAIESLKLGGKLVFATNDRNYYDELRTHLAGLKNLTIEKDGPVSLHSKPRSHFEKKYLARGEPCYEILAHTSN